MARPPPAFLVQPIGPIPVIVQSSEGLKTNNPVTSVTQPRPRVLSPGGPSKRSPWARGSDKWCNQMQSWNNLNGPLSFQGRHPFNQNYRKFRSKTQWIGSVPTGKVSKKLVQLLRWTSFLGRTSRKFWLNRSRPYEHYM